MTRFDHLVRAPVRRFPRTIAIDDRIRGPFAALAAIVIFTACVGSAQYARLRAAQREYVALTAQLAAADAPLATLKATRVRIDNDRRIGDALRAAQQSSLDRARAVAWIGDHLPSDMWLRALRRDDGGYTLEGTSQRTATVGSALLALRDPQIGTLPRLISLHDETSDGLARVHYTLQLALTP